MTPNLNLLSQISSDRLGFLVVDPHFFLKLDQCGIVYSYPTLKSFPILDYATVWFPIIKGKHWTLVIFDQKKKKLTHYDSMHGNGNEKLMTLKNFIIFKSNIEEKGYDATDIITENNQRVPKQVGGDDCGVHLLLNARLIQQGIDLQEDTYNEKDVKAARKVFKYELLVKKIMYE